MVDKFPNAYLYGCLAEAMNFTRGDASVPTLLRDKALMGIINSDKKARWSGAPLRINTSTNHVV